MKRRTFLGLLAAPAVGSCWFGLRSDAASNDSATVAALQTQAAVLTTKIALQTQVTGLQTQAAGGNAVAPQATPAAQALYQADWSHGMDGWQGDPVWRATGGVLTTVNSSATTRGQDTLEGMIFAPYVPPAGVAYAVEAEIRIRNAVSEIGGAGVFAKADASNDAYNGGYHAGNELPENQLLMLGNHHQGDSFWSGVPGRAFRVVAMDNEWHVYRLEVNGNSLAFRFDGDLIARVDDAEFQTGTRLGLYTASYQVDARGFTVLGL
jgi:hypothetical protein